MTGAIITAAATRPRSGCSATVATTGRGTTPTTIMAACVMAVERTTGPATTTMAVEGEAAGPTTQPATGRLRGLGVPGEVVPPSGGAGGTSRPDGFRSRRTDGVPLAPRPASG